MAFGIGAVLVSVTTAANAGVPEDKAGLAAGLLNASQQLGTALGLAIFSAIATARTSALLTTHAPRDAALTQGLPPRPPVTPPAPQAATTTPPIQSHRFSHTAGHCAQCVATHGYRLVISIGSP
jgi:hypothetical protein